MEKKEFEFTGWGTMDSNAKAAWLLAFVLDLPVENTSQGMTVNGEKVDLTPNLISRCEQELPDPTKRLYVKNCMSEAGSIAYNGLPDKTGVEAAYRYYRTLLTLPVENRAVSMYWALKGENV